MSDGSRQAQGEAGTRFLLVSASDLIFSATNFREMVEPPPIPRPDFRTASQQPVEAATSAGGQTSKLAFGAQEFVDAIARRIREHLRAPDLEEPLVVGVFGEWGSGKSKVLTELEEHFRGRANSTGEDQPLTLPILFNAWRFEAEEHLIIPLLKTAEHRILDWQKEQQSAGKKVRTWLGQRAMILQESAIALVYGLKGKLSAGGLGEISFDSEAALEAFEKRYQRLQENARTPIENLASKYYDFHSYMPRLTGRARDTEGPPLNLVFLVDDLDRCLPEKAVQMLESIKLFLEVRGCVFVLAVDDEVVSRGISHRYRDYDRSGQGGFDSIAYSLNPDHYDTFQSNRPPRAPAPITGSEYLEKIIHLPFRISRPSDDSVKSFLRERYPELFVGEAVDVSKLNTAKEKRGGDSMAGGDTLPSVEGRLSDSTVTDREFSSRSGKLTEAEAVQLLEFFCHCVPHVPRKLIRAVELYKMLARVARSRGWDNFDSLLLARVVFLQLFTPDLYRFGRTVPTLFTVMREWTQEVDHLSLAAIERYLNSPGEEKPQTTSTDSKTDTQDPQGEITRTGGDQYLLETRDRPLLSQLREVARHRSGFEPIRMVDAKFPLADDGVLQYYRLRPDSQGPTSGDGAGDSAKRPEARLEDRESFFLQLTSTDPVAWRNAVEVEAEKLRGRILDEKTFSRLKQYAEKYPRAVGLDWLSTLEPHLAGWQLTELFVASRILPRLSDEIAQGGQPT